MSADYQRGRADAAIGKFDPPKQVILGAASTVEKIEQRIQEYREGYNDKRREMGKS